MRSWGNIAAVAIALLTAGIRAQETLKDLGTLLSEQKNLTTFYGLIQKYPNILLKLPSTNGVTILAPSDEAFEKIPYTSLKLAFQNNDEKVITNVLSYHILQGTRMAADLVPGTPVFIPTLLTDPSYSSVTGGQRVGNVKQAGDVVVFTSGQGSRSTLVQADLKFTGGVVQSIDSLLIPPTNITLTAESFNFTSYEGALYASNKVQNISASKDVTLFVPRNEAFLALGPAISSMSAEEIRSVVDYSIVPQVIYSTGLTNGSKFATVQGGNISVLRSGNNVYINSAQILDANILIANGVLHVIDNVLNPQGTGAQPNPDIGTQAPVFASATSVNSLPFTSAIPCTTSCPVPTTATSESASGTGATVKSTTTSFSSKSSKAQAAAMAKETGFRAAGLMAAIGGAVLMI